MKIPSLAKWTLMGAALPLFAGCVTHEVVYRERPAPAVVTEEAPAPPPPQSEVVPAPPGPITGWFWAPGCWEWRGSWVWVPGRWIARPYVGAVWVGPHWGWHGHHRVWVVGTWR